MRLGEDRRWGAVDLREQCRSGMDEGWVDSEMPGVNEAGKGYSSQPKNEAQGWG